MHNVACCCNCLAPPTSFEGSAECVYVWLGLFSGWGKHVMSVIYFQPSMVILSDWLKSYPLRNILRNFRVWKVFLLTVCNTHWQTGGSILSITDQSRECLRPLSHLA